MNWYLFILGSSVGKKLLMAVTGLGLIGFLAVHLLGNVMAFAGAEAFNGYAAKLHSLQPYLTVFNIGLATLGLVHIVVGTILFFENLKARPTRYKIYQNPGGRTIGSYTMPYTGVLILLFVIFHLFKFTFVDKIGDTDLPELMAATFADLSVGDHVCGGNGDCRRAHQSRLLEPVSDLAASIILTLYAPDYEAGSGGNICVRDRIWDSADLFVVKSVVGRSRTAHCWLAQKLVSYKGFNPFQTITSLPTHQLNGFKAFIRKFIDKLKLAEYCAINRVIKYGECHATAGWKNAGWPAG